LLIEILQGLPRSKLTVNGPFSNVVVLSEATATPRNANIIATIGKMQSTIRL